MKKLFFTTFLLSIFTFHLTSCSDNEKVEDSGTGSLNLKITDAPIDEANIKGAYVTISEIKIDGEPVDGFSTQTIDLLAYQNGETKLLYTGEELNAGTYNNIELVLNYESDQWGESPGCFILTEDIVKHNLAPANASNQNLKLDQSFDVISDGSTDLVVDFDLRKAIQYDNSFDSESDYSFVNAVQLENAIRAIVESNTGSIEGKITRSITTDDKLIIYAYHKGEFNSEAEQAGDVKFSNALTSASISESGEYRLSFLPEGEYELHVASYEEDSGGRLVFEGLIEANSLSDNIMLSDISVSSNTKVTLNVNTLGLL